MKKLTVYCIKYGKSKNIFLAIADNSIPFKIISYYSDVEESLIFEGFIKSTELSLVKKVCKDSGRSAILLRNQKSKVLGDFINEVLGHQVTFIEYSFKSWQSFILGMQEYSSNSLTLIEIDHPICLKERILSSLVKDGLNLYNVRMKELNESLVKIKKKYKKEKKKNGK